MLISRHSRIWYEGATYHLMERGVRRDSIFLEKSDYEIFQEFLRIELEKNHCTLHAYCMMTNHFHLLTQTSDIDIGRFMQGLAGKYAAYFNHKHGYRGHVFEGRYRACLVESDAYFLQTSRYIHLNPVKAGMVARPEDYAWSSYRAMFDEKDDSLIKTALTLSYFDGDKHCAYRNFVNNVDKEHLESEEEIRTNMREDESWLPL